MARSLTAANTVITFTIPDLFPVGFQLQGFAADDIFDTDEIDSAEVSMGVDGILSAGFVFVPIRQRYNLQANSLSISYFDSWWQASKAAVDAFPATADFAFPGLGATYTMLNGYLTGYPPVPNAGKIVKPRRFTVTWNDSNSMPI
jgi:hypothetical protein